MVSPLGSMVAGLQQVNPLANIGSQISQNLNANVSRDVARQGMQMNEQVMDMRNQQMQAAQRQQTEQDAIRNVTYLNRLGKRLLQAPESQWETILQPQLPALQQLGFDPQQLGDLSREKVAQVVAHTEDVLGQEAQGAGFTLSEGQVRFDAQGNPIAGVPKPEDEGQKSQPLVDKLRSRYDSFTKDFRQVDAAFRKVQSAPQTAAGDLALIFNYMKLLDPGSVVREGEFATAQNTAGVPDRIRNTYNRLLSGERLGEQQRAEFAQSAQSAFSAQQDSADQFISTILQQADQDGIAREKVLGEKNLREFEKRAADRMISQNKKRLKFNPQTGQLE